MKVLSKLMIAFLAISLIAACTSKPEGEAAKTGDASETVATPTASAQKYTVSDGTIYWTGTKVGGEHSGTIKVGKGEFAAEGGNLTSGMFSIDMSTINVTDDMGDEMKAKLTGHLASADFFDVAAHPQALFEIVSIAPATGTEGVTHNVTGNLTIKGITKSITIPASVVITDNLISVTSPAFTINRTNWKVQYGSGIIGTAKDKIIYDDISMTLEVNANSTPAQ